MQKGDGRYFHRPYALLKDDLEFVNRATNHRQSAASSGRVPSLLDSPVYHMLFYL